MRIKSIKKGSEKLTSAKARLIARCIGDGAVYKYKSNYYAKYEVKDMDLLRSFEKDIINIYGLKPYWETNPSGKTGKLLFFVAIRSKLIYEDLLRYCKSYFSREWRLPQQIKEANLEIKREFLRAFFDDEGSVIPRKDCYKVIIRLYSINKEGLLGIKELLEEFNIRSRLEAGFGLRRNVYALVITKDILKFRDNIGFNSRRKRNKLIRQTKHL